VQLALRLTAVGAEIAAIAAGLRLALARLAICFGPIRRARRVAALVVAALTVTVLR